MSRPPAAKPVVDASRDDVCPMVAGSGRQTPIWLIVGLAALSAVLLFLVLDGRRRADLAPNVGPANGQGVVSIQPPPPLQIGIDADQSGSVPRYVFDATTAPVPPPPPLPPRSFSPAAPAFSPPPQLPQPSAPFTPQPPPAGFVPPPSFAPPPPVQSTFQAPVSAGPVSRGSVLVIDTTASQRVSPAIDGPTAPLGAQGPEVTAAGDSQVSQAGRLSRSTVIARGTVIPAVLETALDSTRPGFARAIVSQDIRAFDGRRVLIPKGSRLFGSYQADLDAGQNRANLQWDRLVRPDGTTITLASPAADLQGRTGVPGRVDSHFLERFGSAVLQTTINIGTSAATRSLGNGSAVILALPGSAQIGTGAGEAGSRIRPTLRVASGTRVSVLVSQDLNFAAVPVGP